MHRLHHSLAPIRRQLTLAVCLGLAVATLAPQQASAQQTATSLQQARSYAIPAGPLTSTLNRFAGEAGIFLSAAGELTAGKRSPGLSGSYSVPQALDALLEGSELDWRIDGDRVTLQRRAAAPAGSTVAPAATASPQTSTLAALQVNGTYLARNSTATGLNLDLRETP